MLAAGVWGCAGDSAEPQEWESAVAAGTRPRHVILFVVDTLRADRLGCYGYGRDTSPAIDLLAARGTTWRANYAQGCWTLPSMLSMLSGLYVFAEEQSLPADTPTLAELLAETGVYTAAFVGNDVLVHDRGFDRGFAHFEGPTRSGSALGTVQRFSEWLDANRAEIDGGRGLFAWIHTIDPHAPYEPPEDFKAWAGEPRLDHAVLDERWVAERNRAAELARPDTLGYSAAVAWMTEESNDYDGEVLAADTALRRLLRHLKRTGLDRETLVIVASDHGEKLWEHPHYPYELSLRLERARGFEHGVADLFAVGHRAWFQEELWRTPLVMAGPGVAEGTAVDALSENLDLFPTVLDAFGLAVPHWVAGHSLLDPNAPPRAQVLGYGFGTTAIRESTGLKLIEHDPRRYGLPEDDPPPHELLDPAGEPDELRNLASLRPDDTARLAAAIGAWRGEVQRDFSTEASAADTEALRRMGYVGDE